MYLNIVSFYFIDKLQKIYYHMNKHAYDNIKSKKTSLKKLINILEIIENIEVIRMKICTYGNKNNEKILLIHPMFTNEEFFKECVNKLKDKYFLIVPTLSGHYENSTYISMENEEVEINNFLENNNINKLKLVIGFSLGGNIAYDFFCKNLNKVEKVIIDSSPIFKFPKCVKSYFYKKYKKCLLNIKENKVNIVDELNKYFHGMGESQKDITPLVTIDSLSNLIESCYNVNLYKLDKETQERITFLYGTKDIARLCLPRIKKYKYSKFVKLNNLNHCEYFIKHLDDYIKELIV